MTDAADRVLPLRPKLIMMSASPSMMRVNSSGVTSLHTLKALKNASLMTSSSRSGVCPRILQGLRASQRAGCGIRTFYLTLRTIMECLEHEDKQSWITKWKKKKANQTLLYICLCIPLLLTKTTKISERFSSLGGGHTFLKTDGGVMRADKTADVNIPNPPQ